MHTRAPLRISFAGGGTDIEPFCSEHGGAVLSIAIQMYTYGTYPNKHSGSTKIEETIARYFGKPEHSLVIKSEAPPKSGLGGSASCFVAGIKAIKPEMTPSEIAELAFYLERELMGVAGGKQDQYMAAFGGFNLLTFGSDDTTGVHTLDIPKDLQSLLLLVYIGRRNHNGHDIIKDQMSRNNTNNFEAQKLIVREMVRCLEDEISPSRMWRFGKLLDRAWYSKKEFSPYITTSEINEFYQDCLKHGAIGGKMPGAGGGGYMLLMEHPERKGELREYLAEKKVEFVNVKFDTEGVKCL